MNQSNAKEDEVTCVKRGKIVQRVPLKRGEKVAREKKAVTSVGKNGKHANNEGRWRRHLAGEYSFITRSKIS